VSPAARRALPRRARDRAARAGVRCPLASALLLPRTGHLRVRRSAPAEFADALEPALERQRGGVLFGEESARLRAIAEIAIQQVERGCGVIELLGDGGFDARADQGIGLLAARGEEVVEEIECVARGHEAPVGVAHERAVRAAPGERRGQGGSSAIAGASRSADGAATRAGS